jgi:hypothetical protein
MRLTAYDEKTGKFIHEKKGFDARTKEIGAYKHPFMDKTLHEDSQE